MERKRGHERKQVLILAKITFWFKYVKTMQNVFNLFITVSSFLDMNQNWYILPEKLESWWSQNGFPGGLWLQPCRLIHYSPQHCSYFRWLHLKHCKNNSICFFQTKHVRQLILCFSVQYETEKHGGFFLSLKQILL